MSLDFFKLFDCKHISDEDMEGLRSFTVRKGGGFWQTILDMKQQMAR